MYFLCFLKSVANDQPEESSSESEIDSVEDGLQLSSLSDGAKEPLAPAKWFKHDLAAVKASLQDKNCQSWFAQFSSVANGILIQCVLMHCGVQQKGGHKTDYDLTRVRQLLERIPTPSRDDGHSTAYPPFPISIRPIAEWVTHLSKMAIQEESEALDPALVKAPRDFVAENDSQFAKLKAMSESNETNDDLTEELLLHHQELGMKKTLDSRASLSEKLETIGTTLQEFLGSDFTQAAFCPPAPMAKPEWTPFLERMALSNVYSQLELMYARVDQMQAGIEFIRDCCETHIKHLSEAKKTLVTKAKDIDKAQTVLGRVFRDTRSLSGEVSNLNQEVSEGMKNPKVAQYVEFQSGSRKPLFAFHDVQSPPSTMNSAR